jgi:hypothetical protein
MKQLLLISPSFPLPLDRGQNIRIYNILLACARDFQITFVGPPPVDASGAEWIKSVCRRTVYAEFRPFEGLTAADFVGTARTLRTIPRPVTVKLSRPYLSALRQVSFDNFHLIVALSLALARLVKSRSDRLVVDLDDVSHIKHLRKLKVHGVAPAAVGEVWNVGRFFFKEVVDARRFLATAVCSEEDPILPGEVGLEERSGCPQRG